MILSVPFRTPSFSFCFHLLILEIPSQCQLFHTRPSTSFLGYFTFLLVFISAGYSSGFACTRIFPYEEFCGFMSFLFYFPSLSVQFHAYYVICVSHFTRFLLTLVSFISFFNPIWIFLVSHLNHPFIHISVDNILLSFNITLH